MGDVGLCVCMQQTKSPKSESHPLRTQAQTLSKGRVFADKCACPSEPWCPRRSEQGRGA